MNRFSQTPGGKNITQISLSGELGWELYVSNDRAVEVYKALVSTGEKYGVGHIGGYAINSMRIEKGFRLWGAEVWKFGSLSGCF